MSLYPLKRAMLNVQFIIACTAKYTHLNPNYIIMTVISYTSRIAWPAITTARNQCKDQGANIGDSVGGDIAQI